MTIVSAGDVQREILTLLDVWSESESESALLTKYIYTYLFTHNIVQEDTNGHTLSDPPHARNENTVS